MSIEWHRIATIEIDLKERSATLKSKEGYPYAKSVYETIDGAMFNADKCFKMMIKAKKEAK